MKKLLIVFTIGVLSILKGFAMDLKVDNPYKDIEIHCVIGSNIANGYGSNGGINYDIWSGNIDMKNYVSSAESFEFFIKLKDNQRLEGPKYHALRENRNRRNTCVRFDPVRSRFENAFILNGKKGKVVYELEIKFHKCKRVIESLKVNVLKATVGGVELDK